MREPGPQGTVILVPYCAACHVHVSEAATRRLAVGISSALLALTLLSGLPLLWQPPRLALYATLVGLGALLPLAVARAWVRAPSAGHAASGRAVWWGREGALVCASAKWGERLAGASGAEIAAVKAHDPGAPRWALAGIVAAVLATVIFYRVHFPRVRIVNVTDAPLTVWVDGRSYARVEPTGGESEGAGIELRIAAGERVLSAVDVEGHVIDVTTAVARAGEEHLYAPASDATCFWIETTGYGRSRSLGARRDPLAGQRRFWTLPRGIDFWFSPAPPPSKDDRSTGGLALSLRQARCDEAPEGAR